MPSPNASLSPVTLRWPPSAWRSLAGLAAGNGAGGRARIKGTVKLDGKPPERGRPEHEGRSLLCQAAGRRRTRRWWWARAAA